MEIASHTSFHFIVVKNFELYDHFKYRSKVPKWRQWLLFQNNLVHCYVSDTRISRPARRNQLFFTALKETSHLLPHSTVLLRPLRTGEIIWKMSSVIPYTVSLWSRPLCQTLWKSLEMPKELQANENHSIVSIVILVLHTHFINWKNNVSI